MAKISKYSTRKEPNTALELFRNDIKKYEYFHKFLLYLDDLDISLSSKKRSFQLFSDILKNNSLSLYEEYTEILTTYRQSKNQYEKMNIRHGAEAADSLKNKYSQRMPYIRIEGNHVYNIDFWINKGLSEQESIDKVKLLRNNTSIASELHLGKT